MTGNVRDNYYPLIRLLPTHPHLASADFIRLLLVATSAHPQIRVLPIAFPNLSFGLSTLTTGDVFSFQSSVMILSFVNC